MNVPPSRTAETQTPVAVTHPQRSDAREDVTLPGNVQAFMETAIYARTAGYLEAKAPYLDYPAALAAGWPISTGLIEGACRHLVKDRMDRTGARWSLTGAEAVLRLRALRTSGDFDAYWTLHISQDQARLYPPGRWSAL